MGEMVQIKVSAFPKEKPIPKFNWKNNQQKFDLNISDIKLHSVLRKLADKMYDKGEGKVKIKSGSIEISDDLKPLSNLFFTLLPLYMERYLGYDYDDELEKKLLKREDLKELIKNAYNFLKEKELITSPLKESFRSLFKFYQDKDNLSELAEIVKLLRKQKFQKSLEEFDRKLFNKFSVLFDYKKKKPKAVETAMIFILRNINRVDDRVLRLFLRGIEHQEVKTAENYTKVIVSRRKIAKKLFGTATPSTDQLEELSEDNPKKFKEWRKGLGIINKKAKLFIEDSWVDNGFDIVSVSKANKLCKSIGVQSPIDPGFEGMVSMGDTPAKIFSYYTSSGLKLNANPGPSVKMNLDYKEGSKVKGEGFYCSALPEGSFTNERVKFYTLDHEKNSSEKIFSSVLQVFNVIEDIRDTLSEDIESKKLKTKISATIARLADLTCGRMGNRRSEIVKKGQLDKKGNPARPVYGLHNLKSKHFKWNKKKKCFIISYVGKGNKDQKKFVYDEQVIKVLRQLLKGKEKEQYVFSLKKHGKTPRESQRVNRYLKTIGFPGGNLHKFRHYHACRIFREFMEEAFKEDWDDDEVLAEFKETIERIAGMLGNTPAVIIKNYLSPLLSKEYFEHFNVSPPKTVKNVIENKITGSYSEGL